MMRSTRVKRRSKSRAEGHKLRLEGGLRKEMGMMPLY